MLSFKDYKSKSSKPRQRQKRKQCADARPGDDGAKAGWRVDRRREVHHQEQAEVSITTTIINLIVKSMTNITTGINIIIMIKTSLIRIPFWKAEETPSFICSAHRRAIVHGGALQVGKRLVIVVRLMMMLVLVMVMMMMVLVTAMMMPVLVVAMTMGTGCRLEYNSL